MPLKLASGHRSICNPPCPLHDVYSLIRRAIRSLICDTTIWPSVRQILSQITGHLRKTPGVDSKIAQSDVLYTPLYMFETTLVSALRAQYASNPMLGLLPWEHEWPRSLPCPTSEAYTLTRLPPAGSKPPGEPPGKLLRIWFGPGVVLSLRSLRTRSAEMPDLGAGVIGEADDDDDVISMTLFEAAAALSKTRAGVWRGRKPPTDILANAACCTCGLGVIYAEGADEASRAGLGVSIPRMGIVDDSAPLSTEVASL